MSPPPDPLFSQYNQTHYPRKNQTIPRTNPFPRARRSSPAPAKQPTNRPESALLKKLRPAAHKKAKRRIDNVLALARARARRVAPAESRPAPNVCGRSE